MAAAKKPSRDLQILSANVHTAESFGRAIISSSLAAAAEQGTIGTRPVKLELNVTITRITGIGAYVCVGIPGHGTHCRIERDDLNR
jgi:hypothetical protein